MARLYFSTTLFLAKMQSDAIALLSNDTIVPYGVARAELGDHSYTFV